MVYGYGRKGVHWSKDIGSLFCREKRLPMSFLASPDFLQRGAAPRPRIAGSIPLRAELPKGDVAFFTLAVNNLAGRRVRSLPGDCRPEDYRLKDDPGREGEAPAEPGRKNSGWYTRISCGPAQASVTSRPTPRSSRKHDRKITPSPRYSGERDGVRGGKANAEVTLRPCPNLSMICSLSSCHA
jgi:hypothetical protein